MAIDKIGKYSIVGELGRGAMGIVYKGVDPYIGRTVAIKTVRFDVISGLHEQEEAIQRFIREAHSAGILSHPNIVTIYDVGEDEGLTYIAMEYIDGKSLEELITSGQRFSLDEIVNLMTQIGDALDYAHQKGIIHRDIKPGNILIDTEGKAHLVDFGIARISTSTLTQTGMSLGTPNYMAPEQIAGKRVDHRADIFSLGTILYELLTNEKPFQGDSFTTVMYKIMNEDPPPLRTFDKNLPDGLDHVIRKALAKTLKSRYQSCRQLTEDLINYPRYTSIPWHEELETGEEIPEPEVFPELQKERKKKPLLFLLGSMMALVLVVTAFIFFYMNKSGRSIFSGRFSSLPPPSTKETRIQAPAEKEKQITEPDKKEERKAEIDPAEKVLPEKGESQFEPEEKERNEQEFNNRLGLAVKAYQNKDYQGCINEAEKVLNLDPNNAKAREYLNLARLDLGIKAFKDGDYDLCIERMEVILKQDPENAYVKEYLTEARKQKYKKNKEIEIKRMIKITKDEFRLSNYQESIKASKKIILIEPENTEAIEYFNLANMKLAPIQIKAIVNKYIQAIKNEELISFYRNICSPALYQRIKKDTELLFNIYDNFEANAFNVSSDVKTKKLGHYEAEVSFGHIMIGVSLAKGTKEVLYEGIFMWKMEKKGDDWKIIDISYHTEGKNR